MPVISERSISLLGLGDSYTIGEAVNPTHRYLHQLAQLLIDKAGLKVETTIIAQTGWTTKDLIQAISAKQNLPLFDFAFLLIGVNNQYQGWDIKIYQEEFETLMQISLRLCGHKPENLFVLSIPDYGVTPFGKEKRNQIGIELDRYNEINHKITALYHASYIDITPCSREALHDNSLIAGDDLHPSEKMYKIWADLIWPVLFKKILY